MDKLQQRNHLQQLLEEHFNRREMEDLYFSLGLEYDELPNKVTMIRDLIARYQRHNRISKLIEALRTARPELEWGERENDGSPLFQRGEDSDFTILFLAAEPGDQARLRLGAEAREIQEKLQLSQQRARFRFEPRFAVRAADLVQALLDVQPRIVHFSGHGEGAGGLCFEDARGDTHAVPAEALAALFAQFRGQVECVVLNACYSEVQARALAAQVPYVVGMSRAVPDTAALAFTLGFYQALGAGRGFAEAFELGKVQVMLYNVPDSETPVLSGYCGAHPVGGENFSRE